MDFDDEEYDIYPFQIYRGFDLSDLSDKEANFARDKIDSVYNDMTMIKEFCYEFLKSIGTEESHNLRDRLPNQSLYKNMLEHSISTYGKQKGSEIADLILGRPDEFTRKIMIAKAKALILSYERQFEDEETEPVHPSEFEESDLFKTISKLSGGRNSFPDMDLF